MRSIAARPVWSSASLSGSPRSQPLILMDLWQAVHASRLAHPEAWGGTPSVIELARRHAEDHRWNESQRSGRDVGPHAYGEWGRQHWRRFCRWRYLEHLLGRCRYREFSPHDFGALRGHGEWRFDTVMEFALDQVLKLDREQLDVLFAAPEHLHRPRLVQVLGLINVNGARLNWPEWACC